MTRPDAPPRAYDAGSVRDAVGWQDAVEALRAALVGGLDPEAEPPRASFPFGRGELLAMPSSLGAYAGAKLVTIAPDNPARGLPRISGIYVLFDAQTLVPIATLDGTALTALRTPAVSALGVDLIARPDARRLVVFGTGPQALGHVHALRAVRPISSVGVVGRDRDRTAGFVRGLRKHGVDAYSAGAEDIRNADVVACCTTAREPLFDGRDLPDHTAVVACGSHEPTAREVDSETARRCGVMVEAVSAAATEAGDVVLAIADGAITHRDLVGMRAVARGEVRARPRLFKTVGMGWEDLVTAAAVVTAAKDGRR